MKPQSAISTQRSAIGRWAALLIATFLLRLLAIHFLTGSLDGDSNGYMNLARNLLREHVYSIRDVVPFYPSFARVPGYPLFIALTYAIGGVDNNTAVRIAQALVDTITCAAVAALAGLWEFDPKKKRTASMVAFLLAALCPFTLRYVPTILAETLSTFFAVVLALAASSAFLAQTARRTFIWWVITGVVGGAGTLVRPDGLLFFLAAVGALIIAAIWVGGGRNHHWLEAMPSLAHAWRNIAIVVLAFTFTFGLWPLRNALVFHRLIPLQPKHQGLPNGFVPGGYYDWLRTWVDDQRYILPFRWEVDYSPIALDHLPSKAFDSPEERARVGQLLDRYNHPESNPSGTQSKSDGSPDGGTNKPLIAATPVRMTAEIDSGFAEIARERRQRDLLRFYVWLPARRAVALWFDTHSDHYPFGGEVFPIPPTGYFKDGNHSYWGYLALWFFAALVWLYTLLGLSGAFTLWRSRQPAARNFVMLVGLIMLPRLLFFSTLDNPEPRFLVQFFPFLAVLGGVALAHGRIWQRSKR